MAKAKTKSGKAPEAPLPRSKGKGDPNPVPNPERPWEGPDAAAKLCRAVDKAGIGFDLFLADAARVKAAGLKAADVTPAVIARAKAIDRTWDASQRVRFERLNRVIVRQRYEDRIVYEQVRVFGCRTPTAVALNAGIKVSRAKAAIARLKANKARL